MQLATILSTAAALCLPGAVAVGNVIDLLQGNWLSNVSVNEFSKDYTVIPFNQDFPSKPTPWKINIDRDFMIATKLKVALTRYHHDIAVPAWSDGPPAKNITTFRNHWVKSYDWDKVEAGLNERYNHFVTTVSLGPHSNFTDPVPLHFIHHRSPHPDAIPFLFIHGTPGNFMEITPQIQNLTNPPPGKPAFHVISPSVPGYGFSPAPKKPDLGPAHMGDAFNVMMSQLGYDKYVVQAGDYGSIILRYMGGRHPDRIVSVLDNFFIVTPNATHMLRYERNQTTPDETQVIKSLQNYEYNQSGYRLEMGSLPLQVVIAMTDSPLGNLAFLWQMMKWLSVDYDWGLDEIITWGLMYYLQGPYGSLRHYKEMQEKGIHAGFFLGNNYPYITVPVGLMEYPGDFWYGMPLDWAQRYGNVTLRIMHDRGAHFPSFQQPDLYLQDVWQFFGNASLSNTGMWLEKQGLL